MVTRYPFVSESKRYLSDSTVSENDLDDAKIRVFVALKAPPATRFAPTPGVAVRNYALDRLLVFALDDVFASRRYANNEAAHYSRLLAQEDEAVIVRVCREFLPSLDKGSVSVLDYVKNASRLAEQNVEGGRVFLDKGTLVSVFREALARRIAAFPASRKGIPKAVVDAAADLKPEAEEVSRPASQFKGSLYSLPCIRRIRKGVLEGKRYYGAMALAIALCRDGVPREQAVAELEDYARLCAHGNNEFTAKEAKNAVDWVYRHPSIGLSCQAMRDQGLTGDECDGCARRRKR